VTAPDPATVAMIVRLYRDEELSIAATAVKTGETISRVRAVVRRERIGRGRATVISDDVKAAIIRACAEDGMTLAQAGAAHCVGRVLAGRALRGPGGLLPPSDAAAIAGITLEELRRLTVSRAVRCVRADNGRRRYSRDDMETLRLVQALRWVFADAYSVTACGDGQLQACRQDFTRTVYADTPDGLRRAIMDDLLHGVR
jgi:hypothetical protein